MKKIILSTFILVLFFGAIFSLEGIPYKRIYHSMVYDIESDVILLFGGQSYHSWQADLTDLWKYDLKTNSWELIDNKNGPPKRFTYHSMVYNPKIDRTVIFGGVVLRTFFEGDMTNEIWSYDLNNNSWEIINQRNALQPGAKQTIVYSISADKFVMMGGV